MRDGENQNRLFSMSSDEYVCGIGGRRMVVWEPTVLTAGGRPRSGPAGKGCERYLRLTFTERHPKLRTESPRDQSRAKMEIT